jgi:hypothetical protein
MLIEFEQVFASSERGGLEPGALFDSGAGSLLFSRSACSSRLDLACFEEVDERRTVISDRSSKVGVGRPFTPLAPLPQCTNGLIDRGGGLRLRQPVLECHSSLRHFGERCGVWRILRSLRLSALFSSLICRVAPLPNPARRDLSAEHNGRDRCSQAIHWRFEQRTEFLADGEYDPARPSIMSALERHQRIGPITLGGIFFIDVGGILEPAVTLSLLTRARGPPLLQWHQTGVPALSRDSDPAAPQPGAPSW